MLDTNKFHPAFTVTNIKTFIHIVLEIEKGQYTSWAALFKNHCTAYEVIDHILSPTTPAVADKGKEAEGSSSLDAALWKRLDATVLQWIYSTISPDLLQTIIQPESTARQAWARLQSIFQDNKHTRSVYLENQFSQVRQDNFPNISAYCQELKLLAHQLANVGALVSNDCMVIQLITGLNESYDGVATFIKQSDPLPEFYEARSRLILEETRKQKQAALNSAQPTALATSEKPSEEQSRKDADRNSQYHKGQRSYIPRGRGQQNQRGRGRGWSSRGRGRNSNATRAAPAFSPWFSPYPWWQNMPQWFPPCTYPTGSPQANQSPGLLGPRPQQALNTLTPETYPYTPTELDTAMQSPDQNWYMDMGATSHMTVNSGASNRNSNSQVQQ